MGKKKLTDTGVGLHSRIRGGMLECRLPIGQPLCWNGQMEGIYTSVSSALIGDGPTCLGPLSQYVLTNRYRAVSRISRFLVSLIWFYKRRAHAKMGKFLISIPRFQNCINFGFASPNTKVQYIYINYLRVLNFRDVNLTLRYTDTLQEYRCKIYLFD